MTISFLVNEIHGGWEPTDTRLGGTEESVVRWAEELARRGHDVKVFYNGHTNQLIEFVEPLVNYYNRDLYQNHAKADICINVKSSEVDPKEPTLYLTNETDATQKDLSKYAGVIWPSEWALENILVNNPRRFVVPHGYDPSDIYPGNKIPKQCLYASSPDRGLMTLLQAWPAVYEAHPDATLKVTYGAPEFECPGVEFLGEVDEAMMNNLYRRSDIWCHPANGGELYGITGVKAQAAGCIPVVIPTMALSETVRHGYFASEQTYAETLIRALSEPEKHVEMREAMEDEDYPTWEDSTSRLLEIMKWVLSYGYGHDYRSDPGEEPATGHPQ